MASRKALVVCNNIKLGQWLITIIRNSGFSEIDEVNNGSDAINLSEDCKYNLIILDECRPVISSVRIINSINKNLIYRTICSFIVLTDQTDRDVFDSVKYEGLNIHGILIKPFESHALQKVILRSITRTDIKMPEITPINPLLNEIILSSKSIIIRVVDSNLLVGVAIRGNITKDGEQLLKKAFYKAYSFDKSVVIAVNISEVTHFDEMFIGRILQFNGIIAGRGRRIVIISENNEAGRRFRKLGIHHIIKTYYNTSDFYTEIGFYSS